MRYEIKVILATFIIIAVLSSGCTDTLSSLTKQLEKTQEELIPETNTTTPDQIRIGAWNIQVYGQSKASNPMVMATIRDVVDDYSIIAIQELRDNSCANSQCDSIKAIMDFIPGNYNFVVSPRLGDSISKEQYLIIYDDHLFELVRTEVIPDPENLFEREPYAVQFRVENGLEMFALVICHIQPDNAVQEIHHLETVVKDLIVRYADPDVIVMGDMNADGNYFRGELFVEYISLIGEWEDTTVSATDCAYDRIFVTNEMSRFVEGRTGYIDRRGIINEKVSDHYPVYFVWKRDN
jgi:endonuclease/exonuclease/phosphatase family metal-dependent hydrolase